MNMLNSISGGMTKLRNGVNEQKKKKISYGNDDDVSLLPCYGRGYFVYVLC